ncbi:MAG: hypothetical protein HOD63_10880 [Bacteroidetes bacterium]|jgi:hypothetical protein|nr:hypothetical protein [Bacteroidota bacterium]MBT5529595.1 hypothetical protein [Cytophagia bacterium]MBT3802164.1 hypothetical protein [Bacteroidota bacterium]MBT3935406.1 hypothetical protein [Bacteroidota bacterium]MBT4339087.1 hypothetical protein [Bacteroidota bacterium]
MKTKKLIIVLIIFVMGLFVFTACEYETIEPVKIVIAPGDSISFSLDIVPIFDQSCNMAGCHIAGHWALDLSDAAASYTDLFDKNMIDMTTPANSELYVKLIEVGSTHDGRSTPAQQALILAWLEDGAKNN